MNIHIPTNKEIYMIAYLTMNGWTPDYEARYWSKSGYTQPVAKGGLGDLRDYTLEEAYDCQCVMDDTTQD